MPPLPSRSSDFPRIPASLELSPELRDKTAVVSGASGFFGSVLVEQLLKDGWSVIGLHRRGSNLKLLKEWQIKFPEKLKLAEADLTIVSQLEEAVPHNISAFFHVASSLGAWYPDNKKIYSVNVAATQNVVDVSLKKNVQKLILTSGLGAYWSAVADECKALVSEVSPKHAATSWVGYTYSKFLQEDVVFEGIERGQWAVSLQPSNMIGPYDRNSYGRLYKAINRGEFPVVTPAEHNFAYAVNVAKAHIAAAKSGVVGQNYLLGGTTASLQEFAGHICDALNKEKPVVAPSMLLFPFAVIGDILGKYVFHRDLEFTLETWALFLNDKTSVPYVDSSKAVKELGYQPEFDLGVALAEAAKWSVNNSD
eukprot:TRINITY_DN3515_c0_g1_i3.p1 TRINITY_DN3515_c0_g1~~TRINITY_DN3515_c0_g1_i3.p1  ORF type:complete len:398 (-),score=69.74 TRINITY_DN3515_c0_g1_i3:27-1124(-)